MATTEERLDDGKEVSLAEGFAAIILEIRDDFTRLEQRVDVLAERIDIISDSDDAEEEIDLALEIDDLRLEIKKLRKALKRAY